MSAAQTQVEAQGDEQGGRLILPTSFGASAVGHILFLVVAFLSFGVQAVDLRPPTLHQPTPVTTLIIPVDFLKPPKIKNPEPQIVQTPEFQIVQPPEPKLAKSDQTSEAPPKAIQRKRKLDPIEPSLPLAQEKPLTDAPALQYITPAQAADPGDKNLSPTPLPSGDGTGAPDGIASTGDPNGLRDPNAAPQGKMLPNATPDGVDTDALFKSYKATVNKAVRRDYNYPLAAKRTGIEGVVILAVVIDATGNILQVSIAKSSGHDILDQAAIEAVRAIGRLPAPPTELAWTQKTLKIPFKFELKPSNPTRSGQDDV